MLRIISGGAELPSVAIVWLLGVSQILGYGTLYYSFSIMAGDIAASLGWPVSWLYGSFSLALLAGGFVAPFVGHRIDRHGGGAVMAIGSVLSAAALCGASLASSPVAFTLCLVAMQMAAALVLYDAAFAVLVQTTGQEARLRITHLTLIAGFASTLFWPLTSWLHTIWDWREILLAFAALNVLLCLPIHIVLAIQHRRRVSLAALAPAEADEITAETTIPSHLHRRTLLLLTAAFALSGFTLSAVLAQMVPLLTSVGLGTSALIVSTLFGPAQVLVRFVNMLIGLKRHPMMAALLAASLLPIAIIVLMVSAPLAIGAVAFAVLLGFGSGLKSIVQGTLPLALFGRASYGARLGWMALARQVLAAAAPFVLAWMIENTGATYALAMLVAVAAIGLLALFEVARLQRRAASTGTVTI